MRLVIIGGSDAGISAAFRARELDRAAQVHLIVADAYPNFSICGLPFYLSGEISDWRLAHRGRAEIEASGVDQAEAAARDLLERYPEVHDGYDRLGMVYEARGQNKQAADCYRKVIEFARQHPEQYDPEFEEAFQGWVEELDPPAAT